MSEKYRPSNGTEGAWFINAFCAQCSRSEHNLHPDDASKLVGCPILDRTFALDVDDPDYPSEWIEDENGPKCIAFVLQGDPIPPERCKHTRDMFDEHAAGQRAEREE